MSTTPYLSVVAASRNDDHGGNPLYRTQIFVDSFLEQCKRNQLRAELILVEWNPPRDRAPLADVIDWRSQNPWVDCRVITVPFERHILLRFARVLPLFQMIGKNVGIRRAQGEYILATNIDILFSDELMTFLAKKSLRKDRQYRCDRWDIDARIPKGTSLDEKLQFARENTIRHYSRCFPLQISQLQQDGLPFEAIAQVALKTGYFELEKEGGIAMLAAKADISPHWLHYHACGDFALMHRDGWAKIGGYPEFELHSLHIDTLGMVTAHLSGFREMWLPPPAVCYHIEHAIGSGLTPEGEAAFYQRLNNLGIGWLDLDCMLKSFCSEKRPFQFNTAAWGLRDISLDETFCGRQSSELRKVPKDRQTDLYAPVAALRPEFTGDQFLRKYIYDLKRVYSDSSFHLLEWARTLQTRLDDLRHWQQLTEAQIKNASIRAMKAESKLRYAENRVARCFERVKKVVV